jgi:hypothetical protein
MDKTANSMPFAGDSCQAELTRQRIRAGSAFASATRARATRARSAFVYELEEMMDRKRAAGSAH